MFSRFSAIGRRPRRTSWSLKCLKGLKPENMLVLIELEVVPCKASTFKFHEFLIVHEMVLIFFLEMNDLSASVLLTNRSALVRQGEKIGTKLLQFCLFFFLISI
ncbi:MAG: hypothetical protein EBT51_10415 [Flavobacteriaceae bacterium]|nr:hypothetical protein [Flavobacteriaceae bacterium]